MWRSAAVWLVLVGCGADGDVELSRTEPFTPLLCTAGTPGDPTCPLNHVELAAAAELRLRFAAEPWSEQLMLSSIVLAGQSVHVEGLYLERWASAGSEPLGSVLLAGSVDVNGETSGIDDVLVGFAPGELLRIRIDAIRHESN
jgi:hypothetical protein